MQISLFGLSFETPKVTVSLWTPWRASALEHRMFEAVAALPDLKVEEVDGERRVQIGDAKSWRAAVGALARVLKGWQEEAEHGERRTWHWLVEGDVDGNGYDHAGEPASLWCLVRAGIEQGGPGEADKSEAIDLEGFSLRIWGTTGR